MRKYYDSPCLIDIAVTNRCNLKCDYCSAESGPFARKDMLKIIENFNKYNFSKVLNTNGTLINDKVA